MKYMIILALFIAGCSAAGTNPEDYVAIPLEDISTDMKVLTYDAAGVDVRYFAVIAGDGEVRTAFDACDVCGGRKGYRQQGDDVVCNNCGLAFDIDSLGTKNKPGGGCWPSYLSHKIENGNVLIEKKELEQGAFRFR
jgi:uncharacterized membrane protein